MPKKSQGKISEASLEEFSSRIKKTDLNTYFIFGAILLVLSVGVYAIFSPAAQELDNGNPACGKIVIATDGPNLGANVSASLSEAQYFLVVDPLSKKLLETIRNPYRSQQPNLQIVYLIAGKGEEAVIVGSIDQQSYDMLMQYGIRVFGGYRGQARKVLSLYRQAKISQAAPTGMQAPQPSIMPNNPMQARVLMGQNVQQGQGPTQAAFGDPNLPGMGGMNDFGMNCPNPLLQGGMGQGRMTQGWNQPAFGGNQQLFICPSCNWRIYAQKDPTDEFPACPNCGVGMAQAGAMQREIGTGQANPNMNNMGNAAQAAFGLGQQAFVCPNCNWRLKDKRQDNSFPNCPNCGSSMAKDMSDANGWQWWKYGQQAANMEQLMPQMNQMTNQPNFWQGPESTKFFLCPNCNWRMYAQVGQGEFPQCPNCKQIMARSGAVPQNQNMQANQAAADFAGNAGAGMGVTLDSPAAPPTILMPHPSLRGLCGTCHQIKGAAVIGALGGQGSTPPPAILMPHMSLRGLCANCHQMAGMTGTLNNSQGQGPIRVRLGQGQNSQAQNL